jgi:endonuclease-8
MPEGDTIFRTARTLQRALAGQQILRFEAALPQLAGIERHTAVVGRSFERVEARGKHVLMHLTGALVLRSHMRMHGSWHIYRPGEAWQRPRAHMRVVFETERFCAVAFNVYEAEWLSEGDLAKSAVAQLGPDLINDPIDARACAERIRAQGARPICDVLLDQRVLAGIGNAYKSELLFVVRTHPLCAAERVPLQLAEALVREAVRLLQLNSGLAAHGGEFSVLGMRRTTGSLDPGARLWVYRRAGEPCRVCGSAIASEPLGQYARRCYYCPSCQRAG